MAKPSFRVDIAAGVHSPLASHQFLARIPDDLCFHGQQNLRHPLGIYNVSISRLCDKLIRLSRRLESYFQLAPAPEKSTEVSELMQEVVDYIELSLYAAAEHVDDIESIASGFFRSSQLRDKNPAYRHLAKSMRQNKRFVSAAANAIKHQQSRIRLGSVPFKHGGHFMTLHGYFIEGVQNGAIGPSGTFHSEQKIFSITTLLWEVLLFALRSSEDLLIFLRAVAKEFDGPIKPESDQFARAVTAAARLPAYTFGEKHPFDEATFVIYASDEATFPLESKLYGSVWTKWSTDGNASFGQFMVVLAGDGKTRQFQFPHPKSVAIKHWQ